MFTVIDKKKGTCDANANHLDRDCYEVDDLVTKQRLLFCPKCFDAQISLRSKGRKNEKAVPQNGQPVVHEFG